jgi:hypothetical protein
MIKKKYGTPTGKTIPYMYDGNIRARFLAAPVQ